MSEVDPVTFPSADPGRGNPGQPGSEPPSPEFAVEGRALSASFAEARGGAYELKFLLTEEAASAILQRARARMEPDPHADPAREDGYAVHSVYFDTPRWDVYHRRPGFQQEKYRLRRYGTESQLFVERKSKTEGRVQKRRTAIASVELHRLSQPLGDVNWTGHWFHQRVAERGLQPVCAVSYQRAARVLALPVGQARLTIDREVCCRAERTVSLPGVEEGHPVLAGKCIVEMKFPETLPSFFRELVAEFSLSPTAVSKYRNSLLACGLVTEPPDAASQRMPEFSADEAAFQQRSA